MSDEFSDLSLSRVDCPHCGATWINGKHIWNTGASSDNSEADLAGLVCNTAHGDVSQCINPKKGDTTGDTWAKRAEDLVIGLDAVTKRLEDQRKAYRDKFGEDPM